MKRAHKIWSLGISAIGAAIVCIMLSGCLMLPVPNMRVEGYGVATRVVDASTGQPIVGARVTIPYSDRRATTDQYGEFHIGPHMQFHFGYLFGVLEYPIWPFTGDMIAEMADCSISATGYRAATFEIWPAEWTKRDPAGRYVAGKLGENGIFVVPSLALQKEPATTQPE